MSYRDRKSGTVHVMTQSLHSNLDRLYLTRWQHLSGFPFFPLRLVIIKIYQIFVSVIQHYYHIQLVTNQVHVIYITELSYSCYTDFAFKYFLFPCNVMGVQEMQHALHMSKACYDQGLNQTPLVAPDNKSEIDRFSFIYWWQRQSDNDNDIANSSTVVLKLVYYVLS